MAIVYRAVKGRELTNAEVDANFSQLANGSVEGFKQSGTDVERSWLSKGRDVVSIEDYGSDGAALAGVLALGRRVLIPSSITSLTLTSGQVATVLASLHLIDVEVPLTINLPAAQLTGLSTTVLRSAGGAKIKLLGASPIETTISSVQSVSGSAGAWTVTLNVASVTGVSVGDVVIVRSVKPGVQAPGTYTTRPVLGALQLQFFQSGSLTTSSTTFTTSGSVFTTYAADGDLLVVGGTVREISGIGTTGGTYSGTAFPKDITDDRQYWYTMRKGTGTVTISGTAVTGSSTSFTTELNAGDIIAVSGSGMRRVASVTDDTNAVLVDSGMNVAVGAAWGPITRGEVHECCAVITAVDTGNNRISYVNTCKSSYAPPIKNVSAGNVTVLTTKLDYGANSGFEVCGDQFELNQIGVVGSNGSTNIGLDLRGTNDNQAPYIALGTKVAVVGFDYGAWISSGMLYADTGNFSGQFTRGVNVTEGGTAWLGSARVSGVTGIGVFYGPGSYVRAADALITGCSLQGVRGDVGGSVWFDFGISSYNVADNFRLTGAAMIHGSGARFIGSDTGSGLFGENGGRGRATGALALCNDNDNLSLTGSDLEITQLMSIGAGSDNIFLSKGSLNAANAGVGYAATNGCNLLSHNRLWVEESLFFGHPTAIRTTDGGETFAESCGFSGNTTNDVNASQGSVVDVSGYSAAATLAPTPKLNLEDAAGTLVTDQAAVFRQMSTYTVETVPSAADYVRTMIYVSNETGGAVPAFSDGTNWRRVTDREIVS